MHDGLREVIVARFKPDGTLLSAWRIVQSDLEDTLREAERFAASHGHSPNDGESSSTVTHEVVDADALPLEDEALAVSAASFAGDHVTVAEGLDHLAGTLPAEVVESGGEVAVRVRGRALGCGPPCRILVP
jgi:hypothetical protein